MNKCTRCKVLKSESDFNWKIKNVKLACHCKDCSRKYIRQHYKNNTQYYLKKAKSRNIKIQKQSQKLIGKYLSEHPCVDCGEINILVLEFDHIDKKMKDMEVSRIIRHYASIDKLKIEISKCEVRCANCHRIKTSLENNSWKLEYMNAHSSTG